MTRYRQNRKGMIEVLLSLNRMCRFSFEIGA